MTTNAKSQNELNKKITKNYLEQLELKIDGAGKAPLYLQIKKALEIINKQIDQAEIIRQKACLEFPPSIHNMFRADYTEHLRKLRETKKYLEIDLRLEYERGLKQ